MGQQGDYLQEINLRKEIRPDILLQTCKDCHSSLKEIFQLYNLFPNQVIFTDSSGCNSLHWACHRNSLPLVKLFLKNFPQASHARDNFGETPLQWACRYGSFTLVQCILEITPQAAAIADNDGRLPIHWASRWDKYDLVQLLMKVAPNTATAKDNYGWTPHLLACRWSSKDVTTLLIGSASTKNETNNDETILESLDATSEFLDHFMERFNSMKL